MLALCHGAGVEPRVLERNPALDLAQTPIVEGRAVAIVGESSRTALAPELTWLPLRPPAALEVAIVARAHDRSPALDRLLATTAEVGRRAGLARRSCRAGLSTCPSRLSLRRRRAPSLAACQTMTDSKQVVERYVTAVAAGDEHAIRDSFAEDATWWLGGDLPISGTWNGREAIMGDFLATAMAFYEPGTVSLEVTGMVAEGDRVTLEWTSRARTAARRALRELLHRRLHRARRPDRGRPRVHGHASTHTAWPSRPEAAPARRERRGRAG